MTLDKLNELSLIELKLSAKEIGIRGYSNVKSKDKLIASILNHCEEFGLEEIPDLAVAEEDEPVTMSNRPIPMAKKRIKDFPRKKVIIESRDPEEADYPFSVNEYSCYVQMGKPVLLPEPVISFIETITDVYYRKDLDTGFQRHEELNKFFVRYV